MHTGVFMTRIVHCCVLAAVALVAEPALAEESKVTLPLHVWEGMLKEVERADEEEKSPVPVLPIAREIDGSLRKGLFSGTLTVRFMVHESSGHVRVPVLDSGASLGDVRLDGQRTSLLREGGLYTVGVDEPGIHRLTVEFYWGKEQDRFARRLQFRLPDAGPTRLSVLVPERDIEARLAHGVLTAERRRPDGTLLEGQLDPSGVLDLSWNRKLTHRAKGEVRWESRLYTLFTVQETLIQGLTAFDLRVVDGETDRVDLRVPSDIEVVRVEGDAVLQWHTSADDGGKLTVLFRYLVESDTRVTVHFQFPAGTEETVSLRMPLPPAGAPVAGALGVQGPAGLNVQPVATGELDTAVHDLPTALTDLTTTPLLFGLQFTEPPGVGLKISRHESVELTSTIIDDLQASTVLIEDGSEVTKVKLRIRNNTRQYLSVKLPEGAVLTHSLIDGQPIRPAAAADGRALLFPLRQSERIQPGQERTHVVSLGDTLTGLSNFYFSDPNQWQSILEANPDRMVDEWDLAVGQELRIPAKRGAAVQESSFVIELAYKRPHRPLGVFGFGRVSLPEVDVDTVEVTWHLYLPRALEPMSFRANLTQYSAIRYDPFRRVRDFLRDALWIKWAWAGAKYQNILTQRRGIFAAELDRKTEGKMVLSAFPLVGERYRFKHILIGQDTPRISFVYADRDLVTPLRWLALAAAFVLALLVLSPRRTSATWWIAGLSLVVLLVLGHFVLGTHRRIVWGIDIALLVLLVRAGARPAWRWLVDLVRAPWRAVSWLTFANLALLVLACVLLSLVLIFPLLLSTIVAVVLFIWWRRKEVSHA